MSVKTETGALAFHRGKAFLARRNLLVGLISVWALFLHTPVAQAASEYQVKAAFLYNFAKFVDWPGDAFKSGGPFVIGVVGDDPFGSDLDDTVSGKSIDDRRIEVKRFKRVSDIQSCHILFVCRSEKSRVDKILDKVSGSRTLTVGDMGQFLQRGGMINFIMEDQKVRFEINADSAQRAGLKISSKLLQLSRRS